MCGYATALFDDGDPVIRYIHIGDDIDENADAFAFFNTCTNRFVDINHEQVFDSIANLEEALKLHQNWIPHESPYPMGWLPRPADYLVAMAHGNDALLKLGAK